MKNSIYTVMESMEIEAKYCDFERLLDQWLKEEWHIYVPPFEHHDIPENFSR